MLLRIHVLFREQSINEFNTFASLIKLQISANKTLMEALKNESLRLVMLKFYYDIQCILFFISIFLIIALINENKINFWIFEGKYVF